RQSPPQSTEGSERAASVSCGVLCGLILDLIKSNARQRLLEITEHINFVFQADRNTHQTFIDSRGFSQFARKLKAPHRSRVHDQRLKSAQTGGARGEPERGYEFVSRRVTSAQFDAQHSSDTAHLRSGQLMLRMRREAWIIDPRDFRMMF